MVLEMVLVSEVQDKDNNIISVFKVTEFPGLAIKQKTDKNPAGECGFFAFTVAYL